MPEPVDLDYWGTLEEWDQACESFFFAPQDPEEIRLRVHHRRNRWNIPFHERMKMAQPRPFTSTK